MKVERLEEIKRRANAAIKGPWYVGISTSTLKTFVAHRSNGLCMESVPSNQSDHEFMAHSRQDVPDLVAEVERLKKALDQAIAVSELGSHCPGWMSCERNDEIEASGYPELAAYLKETAPITKEGE